MAATKKHRQRKESRQSKSRESDKKQNIYLRVARYVAITLVVFIAVFILANLYDQDMDAEAAAAMSAKPASVPDSENAYFVYFGLGVAPAQNPHAHGLKYVAANKAYVDAADRGESQERSSIDEMDRQNRALEWRGKARDLCNEQRVNCLAEYARKRADIQKLVGDNRVRLARYRSLYRYKHFSETMPLRVYTPLPSMVVAEHETTLAQIALKAVDGNVEGSLSDLAADTAYWRRVLSGAGTLISKVVAANFLNKNYSLASEIGARYKDRPDVRNRLARIATPLSVEEKDWKKSLVAEFQLGAHLYHSLYQGEFGLLNEESAVWEKMVAKLFLKPNATVNRHFEYSKSIQSLSTTPPGELLGAGQRIQSDLGYILDPPWFSLGYNGVGKIVVGIGSALPDRFVKYIGRTHNLDARIRLIRLQLDIYQRNLADKDIEPYLEKTAADLLDPFRNKPFRWEPAKQELWFEGINPKSEGEITNTRITVRI